MPTCFHVRIPKPCLSVPDCPYPEKRNHLSFVNISPTLVIDTSMERSSRLLQHAHGKCEFHKIKVAKARKNSSVRRHFPEVIYRGSVAVHFSCSLSTTEATFPPALAECFTRLVIIPLVPGEKVSAVMFCKQFVAYAVHINWCYQAIHKHSSRS